MKTETALEHHATPQQAIYATKIFIPRSSGVHVISKQPLTSTQRERAISPAKRKPSRALVELTLCFPVEPATESGAPVLFLYLRSGLASKLSTSTWSSRNGVTQLHGGCLELGMDLMRAPLKLTLA